jgi:hypothetical protein
MNWDSKLYKKKPAMRGAQFDPIGIPTIWQNTLLPKQKRCCLAKMYSINHVLTSPITVYITFIVYSDTHY